MRRTTTVALVTTVLLALTAGVALAATIDPIDCSTTTAGGDKKYDCWGTKGDDTINGKPGPDDMVGYEGNDTMNGFAGDDKIDALEPGGNGNDTVLGGPGNDTIAANDGVKDDIRCGGGSRDVVFSDKGQVKDMVSSDCEWRRTYNTPLYCTDYDGGPPWTEPERPGDWPQGIPWVGEKIIWCIDGTPRDDKKLDGTTGHSDLLDSIWGDKGDDTLNGGLGLDSLTGWSGNDILKGGAGPDFLYGDSSANPWEVGHFFRGAGEDKIDGGPGNDFIAAVDNKKDTISCGGGDDYVQADKRGEGDPETGKSTVTDKVAKDCEKPVMTHGEHSSLYCRIFGHRKRH
jgi:Ca2+-binding RTX toxin-like protein